MADRFIDQIVAEIAQYNADHNMLWSAVKAQNSPNRKEWDATPMVVVCPSYSQEIKYLSFCGPTVTASYDCFLISNGNLASNFTDTANSFLAMGIALFMPQSAAMLALGSWQTRVSGKYDFDRGIYPNGYLVTCFEIKVYYIN